MFTMPRRYDVIFTDRRVVAVAIANLAGYYVAGGALGGVIGGLLAGAAASAAGSGKDVPSYDSSRLNHLLESKGSFEIPYRGWQGAWYYGLLGNLLKIRAGGHSYYFKVPKAVRSRMSALLHEAEVRKRQ